MQTVVSTLPDKLLRLTQPLPWPANSAAFNALRRLFEARAKTTGEMTRHPGGLNTPYLDIAVFSEADRSILDALKSAPLHGN
jgi:hypothetical protein